jgi:DnaK suppressor protein
MTETELRGYRRRLLDMVGRLSGDVPRLLDLAGGVGEADADPGTRDAAEDLALCLVRNEEPLLAEARAALDRIDRGTFGRCEGCGKPVGRERLRAVPYARHCVACARQHEAEPGPTQG